MVRDAAISIRVDSSLKERLELEAEKSGISLAKFVEQALEVHSQTPKLQLENPEIVYSPRWGARVKLDLAVGWPAAFLPLEHAEKLGKDLREAVAIGKKLKP